MNVNKVMTQNRKQNTLGLNRKQTKNQHFLNLEKKGEWDKDWVISWVLFPFYSFHFIKQVFAYLCMYVNEHV